MEIFISFEFQGFHYWDKAPDFLSFLRSRHRHIFKCKVWFKVNHNDRDLEFITLKNIFLGYFAHHLEKDNCGSCEMICEEIAEFSNSIPNLSGKITRVEVSEDGENGALLFI